tara:strand:+ start:543 stop:974 length:432 start_codon:yes stop_codon:yes gene_type:complete
VHTPYQKATKVMSVRVVRMRNGEDVIADVFEIAAKDEPEKAVAFRMDHPYNVYVVETDQDLLIESEGVQKMSSPEIQFTPWAPLSKDRRVILRLDEIISAYDTYPEVIEKYNELVEAANGRGSTDTSGSGTVGSPTNLAETKK